MPSETTHKFSPEVRDRAVRMVPDHEAQHPCRWAAILSIAAKIGCTAQTLNEWVKKAEWDTGRRPAPTAEMANRLKSLKRENRELRQANDILCKASACFARPRRAVGAVGSTMDRADPAQQDGIGLGVTRGRAAAPRIVAGG